MISNLEFIACKRVIIIKRLTFISSISTSLTSSKCSVRSYNCALCYCNWLSIIYVAFRPLRPLCRPLCSVFVVLLFGLIDSWSEDYFSFTVILSDKPFVKAVLRPLDNNFSTPVWFYYAYPETEMLRLSVLAFSNYDFIPLLDGVFKLL